MKQTHPNSKEALENVYNLSSKHMQVYLVYRQNTKPLTDRQVKEKLGLDDMNEVRPRISELLKENILTEFKNVKDEKTGKTVRTVSLNPFYENKNYYEPQGSLFQK